MTDGPVAPKGFEMSGIKNLGNQSHSLVQTKRGPLSRTGSTAGAFLSPMLEGKETVVGQQCGILVAIDGENATFMFGTVGFGQGNKFVEAAESRSGNFSLFSPAIKHHLGKQPITGVRSPKS